MTVAFMFKLVVNFRVMNNMQYTEDVYGFVFYVWFKWLPLTCHAS